MTQLINLAESNTVQMSNDSKYHKKVARKKERIFIKLSKTPAKTSYVESGAGDWGKSLRPQT